jgi:hypothetical protein
VTARLADHPFRIGNGKRMAAEVNRVQGIDRTTIVPTAVA